LKRLKLKEQILGLLAAHPRGLSVRGMRDLLDPVPSQPTLSRRLMALRARGEVARVGEGPATRYIYTDSRHRLAEIKSLALHEAIAHKLVRTPELIEIAQQNLDSLRVANPAGRVYHEQWQQFLQGDRFSLLRLLTSDSEAARALRQESPFGGILSPEERRQVLQRYAAA
jgi:hypothetical protein